MINQSVWRLLSAWGNFSGWHDAASKTYANVDDDACVRNSLALPLARLMRDPMDTCIELSLRKKRYNSLFACSVVKITFPVPRATTSQLHNQWNQLDWFSMEQLKGPTNFFFIEKMHHSPRGIVLINKIHTQFSDPWDTSSEPIHHMHRLRLVPPTLCFNLH
jgi:hypothetical protein